MIVADTNVVAYLLIPGDHTEAARRAYLRDPAWAAPLWRRELRNVLVVYVRRGHLALADAQDIQREAESLMTGREYDVESANLLALAASSDRSAYDCESVAVAGHSGFDCSRPTRRCSRALPTLQPSCLPWPPTGPPAERGYPQ